MYNVRLHVNGHDRIVQIDDRLPHTPSNRLMCASTTDDLQIWPGLLEKAYLYVLGGVYDFSGSNPAADLHLLLGWIPEHVPLRSRSGREAFKSEREWKRICEAWNKGGCLLTAGTTAAVESSASISSLDARRKLEPSHAYCVIDVQQDEQGRRFITLLNPWRVERGEELRGICERIITLTWEEACANLGSLYLNWDPEVWSNRLALHLTWGEEGTVVNAAKKVQTVPLSIEVGAATGADAEGEREIWVLLARHMKDRKEEEARKAHINLHLVEKSASSSKAEMSSSHKVSVQRTVSGLPRCLLTSSDIYRATGLTAPTACSSTDSLLAGQHFTLTLPPWTAKAALSPSVCSRRQRCRCRATPKICLMKSM